MKLFYVTLSVLIVSALVSSSAYATSGTVILARGVVTATNADNSSRVLAKGVSIEQGDIINTAKKSFAVIRMLDNTKLTLKPGTTVAIGKFSLEEGKEEACINLVKGGLRTVTGLIGKRNPDSFNVDTPIASIGIRGTDFITRICAGDECLVEEEELSFGEYGGSASDEPQSSDVSELINEQLPEGLYGSCETGAIVMSKCAGQAENFEIGSCRVTQQKDCTSIGLEAGTAGYTSFDPVTESSAKKSESDPSASSEEGESKGAEKGDSRAKVASQDKGGSQENGAVQETGSEQENSDSQAKVASQEGGVAESGGATQPDDVTQASPVSSPNQPVLMSTTPSFLSEDPYFALSDASDAELDNVDLSPASIGIGSGGGQCSDG
jgi:hypothetical protein